MQLCRSEAETLTESVRAVIPSYLKPFNKYMFNLIIFIKYY